MENTSLLDCCIHHFHRHNIVSMNKYLQEYLNESIIQLDTVEDIIDDEQVLINQSQLGGASESLDSKSLEYRKAIRWKCIQIINKNSEGSSKYELLNQHKYEMIRTIRDMSVEPHIYIIHILHCLFNTKISIKIESSKYQSRCDRILGDIIHLSAEEAGKPQHLINLKYSDGKYSYTVEDGDGPHEGDSAAVAPPASNVVSDSAADDTSAVLPSDSVSDADAADTSAAPPSDVVNDTAPVVADPHSHLKEITDKDAIKKFNLIDIDLYNSENQIDRSKLVLFLEKILKKPDTSSTLSVESIHQIIDINKQFLISIDNIKQYLLTLPESHKLELDKYNFVLPGIQKKTYEIKVKHRNLNQTDSIIICKLIFVKNVWKLVGIPEGEHPDRKKYIFNITLDPSIIIYCANDYKRTSNLVRVEGDAKAVSISIYNENIRTQIVKEINNSTSSDDKKLKIINMLNQLDNVQFTQFSKFYNNTKNINLIDKYIINSKYVTSACTSFTKIIIKHNDGRLLFNNISDRDIYSTNLKSIILYKTEGFTDNNYMTFIDHVRKVLRSMSNTDQNNIRMFREVLHVQKAMGYKWSNSLETWKERDFILYNSKLYYFKLPDRDEIHKYSQLRGIIDMKQGVQLFGDCSTKSEKQEAKEAEARSRSRCRSRCRSKSRRTR